MYYIILVFSILLIIYSLIKQKGNDKKDIIKIYLTKLITVIILLILLTIVYGIFKK